MKKNIAACCILALLQGCISYSQNGRPVTLPDGATNAKFGPVSVISPKEYDYYNFLFDQYKVFSNVKSGYGNSDLEIQIQRSSEPNNQGMAIGSLFLSAFTLWVIPTISTFQEKIEFTTYYKGNKIDSREYVASKQMTMWLFNPPQSSDSGKISRDIDKQFVGKYLSEISREPSIRKLMQQG